MLVTKTNYMSNYNPLNNLEYLISIWENLWTTLTMASSLQSKKSGQKIQFILKSMVWPLNYNGTIIHLKANPKLLKLTTKTYKIHYFKTRESSVEFEIPDSARPKNELEIVTNIPSNITQKETLILHSFILYKHSNINYIKNSIQRIKI